MKTRKAGFTLVELLVVIILVAVLVAVALPRYMDAVYRGKVAACKQNISDLNTAERAYEAQLGGTVPSSAPTCDDLVTAGILDAVPVCPFGIAYSFKAVNSTTSTSTVIGYTIDTSTHFAGTDWKNATDHL